MIIDFLKFLWDVFERHILPFQVIRVYERGVLLTLGKWPKLVNPGLRFKFPFIQEIFTTPVKPDTLSPKAVHVTTLDGKTITVQPAIEYEIEDAQKWLIDCTDAVTNLNDLVRGYVADHLTDITWEEVVKKSTRTTIKNRLNNKVQDLGCKVNLLMFTEICQNKVILTSFG
jgi:regulator of protease activity HflC (stomatin/prohibitin superfamily)